MISSATLYRASGLALLLGALLDVIVDIFDTLLFSSGDNPQQALSLSWLIVTLLSILSSLLIIGGLPGICVRQCAQAGRLGLMGFVLTLVSGILLTGFTITRLLAEPYLAANAPGLLAGNAPPAAFTTYTLVAALLVAVGAVLLGVATMRAGVFSRWAGLLLIVSVVLNLATLFPLPEIIGTIADVLFALGLAWMGSALLRDRAAKLVQPLAAAQVSG
jgi:hypothetical protein